MHGSFAAVSPLILVVASCATTIDAEPGAVDWNRYYSTAETHAILRAYADRYPDLTKVYSIGKSYLGQDLMVIEITNEKTKPAAHKPGIYVDGNIHSGELTGSAVALYLVGQLLDNFGSDPRVTELLNTRVFYVRPKFNPDGADLSLLKDASLRSSVRPWDNDGDGQMDEDPEEDLNGDGFITWMRIQDPAGDSKQSVREPRMMVRRGPNDQSGPFYRVIRTEGIDNDGDGRINEDGIGGLDLNRNFPRNWALQFRQSGAGPFPLSEPETHATAKFIDDHQNITAIVHGHTSGGFVYRLPSASNPELFNKEDLRVIKDLGAYYTETTGRPVRPSSTDPIRHRFGTLISWGYWDQGVIGWVPEYWPGLAAGFEGSAADREIEQFRINDEELGGAYFVDWQAFDHPELGAIEIGGWRAKFIRQNPPAKLLRAECELQIPWIYHLAQQSPLIRMSDAKVTDLEPGRFQVEVTVENTGYLPTNLTERGKSARVVEPVLAEIQLTGFALEKGNARTKLGHLAGYSQAASESPTGATATWIVRRTASDGTIRITARSEKGGTVVGPLLRPAR